MTCETDYNELGWNMMAITSLFPCEGVVLTSDVGVVKELANQRARFPKPLHHYEAVQIYGPVLSSNPGLDPRPDDL